MIEFILDFYKSEGKIMEIILEEYQLKDVESMVRIWNEVVEEGVAFPQEELLTKATGEQFCTEKTYCGVASEQET